MGLSPQNSWSTPQVLGPVPESPRTGGRTRGPSDTSAIRPGGPVDPAGPSSCARDTRYSWSTPHALGARAVSPGTAGRPHGPSGVGPCRTGELVDPAGTRTQAVWPWRAGQLRGPLDPGPRGLDRRSTTKALGLRPWSPGTVVEPVGRRTSADSPRLLVDPAGPWAWSESLGTAGGHRGSLGTGLRGPGRLVDTAGPPTRS